MTPTEEQRAALKRVVAYMDEMYAIASPYHGCTEDADLLRAMIDSSGTVEPVGGFDLERARGLRDFLQDDCAEVGDVWAEMIAEIERLREALDESEQILAHKTKTATHWYEEGLKTRADLVQSKRVVEQQAARLKELESSLDEAEALTKKNADLMNAYLARIAELEDALVEGLTNFLHYRASCYDPARRCPYAKECDDCSTWDACGHVEKFRSEARQLLQAEGKIGPDARPKCDHEWQAAIEERGYQTCLKCGECRDIKDIPRTAPTRQITEERKAAIQWAEEMAGDCKAGDVLRDMLAEVTR